MNFGHLLEKKENLTESDLLEAIIDPKKAENQGDIWTFVAVLPETSFVHTTHTAERTLEQAQIFEAVRLSYAKEREINKSVF